MERAGGGQGRILLIGKSHKKRNIGLRHANRFGCRHKIVIHTSPTTTPKCPHCSSVSQSLFISLYKRLVGVISSLLRQRFQFLVSSCFAWDEFFVWFCNSYYFVIYYILDYFYLFIPPTPPTYTALPPSAIILMGRRGINIFRCLYWWTLLAPPPVHP